MTHHSDDALALAGEICGREIYPRFADMIRQAITNCTLDSEPLTDEQCEQIYRAAFWAGDGVLDSIAHVIDDQTVMSFRRTLEQNDA